MTPSVVRNERQADIGGRQTALRIEVQQLGIRNECGNRRISDCQAPQLEAGRLVHEQTCNVEVVLSGSISIRPLGTINQRATLHANHATILTHMSIGADSTRLHIEVQLYTVALLPFPICKGEIAIVSEKSYYVYLNRPFVYMIVDDATGLPLFMGAVQSID